MTNPTNDPERPADLTERVDKLEEWIGKIGSPEELVARIIRVEDALFAAKEVLTLEEASVFLGASKSQLYKLTRTFAIPHYKPGGKTIYFYKNELLAWIKESPVKMQKEYEQDALRYVMNKPLKRK